MKYFVEIINKSTRADLGYVEMFGKLLKLVIELFNLLSMGKQQVLLDPITLSLPLHLQEPSLTLGHLWPLNLILFVLLYVRHWFLTFINDLSFPILATVLLVPLVRFRRR